MAKYGKYIANPSETQAFIENKNIFFKVNDKKVKYKDLADLETKIKQSNSFFVNGESVPNWYYLGFVEKILGFNPIRH
jgi:hypothetical protein